MKAGLKRIEATLHDLGNRDITTTESSEVNKQPLSFRISVSGTEKSENDDIQSEDEYDQQPEEYSQFHHTSVQTFPVEENGCKTPSLPKFKTPSFSNHRNAANPALAMNLLQEIQEIVACWQAELQKIVRQIQDVYLEGPIVNGWLESHTDNEPRGSATLRHAEVNRLMDYVEEICAQQSKISYQSSSSGYRLCGLDASGTVWTRPCPPDQVASVSMAIARYQKLRQLLGRKQYLETRLSQLAETLVVLHGHIQCQ
ncbi:hypothetical protein NIES592_05620 [Fischerella major NIES-592]|uniref:Uncharacterized protein n=2 Tax=Fischerella TaxID=1190 RepID=A0A1U7H384_9CYAN|nr:MULTISPECIES: hypothetical protein [Fischerella]OKH15570.1 hypothetical protein NIES592_05620 [Fischerella major NIES-592]PMB48048.1 hypothetical protein CEN41_02340 [Fischerella thermalis CCMEE 5330]BAU04667.1 hypothetical protein FIS3754_05550 [Fischerella sp. NIES-3754]BCX06909.1 MAG: hypothetical protein KatS3mg066_0768 [Fischerella sp.]